MTRTLNPKQQLKAAKVLNNLKIINSQLDSELMRSVHVQILTDGYDSGIKSLRHQLKLVIKNMEVYLNA